MGGRQRRDGNLGWLAGVIAAGLILPGSARAQTARTATLTSSTARITTSTRGAGAELDPMIDPMIDPMLDPLILDPDAASDELDPIVVTGSRTEKRLLDAPVATEVIGRREIEASGAENLSQLLQQHPGVELERTTRGSGIQLQGLDSSYVLILVDGERQTGRIGGGVDPARYALEDVQQVEIVKGASSALYGSDAIGGVVNIITKQSKKPFEADARAVYGSFDAIDLTAGAGLRQGDFSARFDGGWHRGDGFDLDESVNDPAQTGAAFSELTASGRGEYRIDQDTKIGLRASWMLLDQETVDATILGDPPSPGAPPLAAVYDRTQSTELFSGAISPELRFGDEGRLRASGHYQRFRLQILQDQRGDDAGDTFDDIVQHIGEATLQYDRVLFDDHHFTLGLEGLAEAQTGVIAAGSDGRQRGAVFVQDEWHVLDAPNLVLVPGVRADGDSQFGGAVSPRIAARFDPTERVTLRGSFGLGFRAPTFEELYLDFRNPGSGYRVAGNAALEPERAISASLGAELAATSWLRLGASGFVHDIDNLIITRLQPRGPGDPEPMLNVFQYDNVSSAFTRGLELVASVQPVRPLRIELGYALTDTFDRENQRPLEGRATHKGTVQVSLHSRDLGFDGSIRGSLVGERPFYLSEDPSEPDRPTMAEPYVSMDARVSKSIGEYLSAFAGAENIFDAGHKVHLPIAPRSFYAGIAARFDLEESEAAPVGQEGEP